MILFSVLSKDNICTSILNTFLMVSIEFLIYPYHESKSTFKSHYTTSWVEQILYNNKMILFPPTLVSLLSLFHLLIAYIIWWYIVAIILNKLLYVRSIKNKKNKSLVYSSFIHFPMLMSLCGSEFLTYIIFLL